MSAGEKMPKWKPKDMPTDLIETLSQTYTKFALSDKNISASKILYARELTERETEIVSSNVMVQCLYRFNGTINFLQFNRAINQFISTNEIMRSNFIQNMAVVFNGRNELPEIICQNLQKLSESEISVTVRRLMDSDKRRGIDLAKGHLIRLALLHTAPTEYLILVTMSQMINEHISPTVFLGSTLDIDVPSDGNYAALSEIIFEKTKIGASIREYWSKILSDLPVQQQLPYYKPSDTFKHQCIYRVVVPYEIASEIRRRSQSNRLMLMTILQTAWGLMLQDFNRSADAAFYSLIPSRDQSMAYNTIPIRLKLTAEMTIAQLIQAQFQQLLVSQPYGQFGWTALKELTGMPEMFNHFLSFTEFMSGEMKNSKSESALELINQKYWNAKDSQPGVHFYFDGEQFSIVLKYDEDWFDFNEAIQLMQRYLTVLGNMMADWALSTAQFKKKLAQRFALEESKRIIEDERSKIQSIVSKMEILQGINEGTLQYFTKVARLETRFDGDRILGDELKENFIIVADGMLTRSIDAGDGWFNMLDMVMPGLPVNESILLDQQKYKLTAEVADEQATLVFIPLDEMRKILKQSPQLWQNIALHALDQMENYQSIWVQA